MAKFSRKSVVERAWHRCEYYHLPAYDPETDELVPLFNPRADNWTDHFLWEGSVLRGKTPMGRATISLLRNNDPARAEHRRLLMAAGLFSTLADEAGPTRT
jgi:hypothetical protein